MKSIFLRQSRACPLTAMNFWLITSCRSSRSRTRLSRCMLRTNLFRCNPSYDISWHRSRSSSQKCSNCSRIASLWCSKACALAWRTTWSLCFFPRKQHRGIFILFHHLLAVWGRVLIRHWRAHMFHYLPSRPVQKDVSERLIPHGQQM